METTTQERSTRGYEPSTIQTDHTPVGAAERVSGDLTEWSIGAAKESARLVAELQMAVFDALRESHVAALTTWPVALADPLRLYQRAFMETIDSTQRALTFMGANARVVMHAVDRLQAAATDTALRVRETLAGNSGLGGASRRV